MADQEQELERVSSELEDLRGNMGQVMEILQVIREKLDTQTTIVSEIAGPSIEPQPARTVPTTWPAYGLPPGFTSPVEGAPGFAQSTQQMAPLPTINENHPVVYTFAPPLGSFENLELIRNVGVKCPLLCKEFIIDAWQLYYDRSKGADVVLLIVAVLPDLDIKYMVKICKLLGLAALVEVHDKREFDCVLGIESVELIGINNLQNDIAVSHH
ncbi:uncharacterized protein LOC127106598 [Lathyrus oleraceus]|uniref:uncharacterized protein LOC127106598 n=1 Tax=Pisum sativum TaxID=3888 RepID=UPI0021D3E82F|nr:uncharacterized protein LOC127106598 [Pisum sativum]